MIRRPAPVVSVHRANERFHTRADGRDSWHSFSFGAHHDPDNTHHGLLIAHNEERLLPGAGFSAHPHREVEIVTWVLSGTLRHEDSTGHRGTIYPGLAQRMSAGRGVVHAETNDEGGAEPVHFVQMWLPPDERGRDPGYAQAEVDLNAGPGWQPIVSGLPKHRGSELITLDNSRAAMLVAALPATTVTELPDAPYVHLFVAAGAVTMDGVGRLDAGDAVRLQGGAGQRVTSLEPAQLILWEMTDHGLGAIRVS